MNQFIIIGKVSTLILWAVLVVNLFYPLAGEIYSQYLIWGFLALIAVHFLEAIIYMNKNKDADQSVFINTMQVFVFGFFHPLSLKN